MKSSNVAKFYLLAVFLLILLSVTACHKELEYPLGMSLPESDIVFMPDSDSTDFKENSKTLGFINSDGSKREEFTFSIAGSKSMFGKQFYHQYATDPRWALQGDMLVFSIRDSYPNMRLIDQDGKMYGRSCMDLVGGSLTFDLNGNILVEIGKFDHLHEEYKHLASGALIARYDLKMCQIVSVFSLPLPFNSAVREINEADNGMLVAAFYDFDGQQDAILLYDQITEEHETIPGYHPSLTEDGTMLAYYNKAGTLVIRDMQTGAERNLLHLFSAYDDRAPILMSMPGWSPDHQWLVYNTPEGEIFKVNIETGQNIYLTYGWEPDWRTIDGPHR